MFERSFRQENFIRLVRFSYRTTLKRNRNATVFQWKIYGTLFEVLDRYNGFSSLPEKLSNTTKESLKR